MRFTTQASRRDAPELSLVSLIDVVLVILIFLSVTTTFSQVGQLRIDLPEGEAQTAQEPETIHVQITAHGQVFVEGVAVPTQDVAALRQALVRQAPAKSDPVVVIEADAATPHQRVIDALRAAQEAGLAKVTFAVEQPQ
ncbi:MAG TPA: biopolymer transporter ExbD [Hydrogenophilus thermoluteolus]|nr:biopolymer transporter ExbD [Hydrogenophilus thermoluteolus]